MDADPEPRALEPVRFIEEVVEVTFERPPVLEKRPCCPAAFTWRGETYRVVEMLAEWQDYTRRGRFARNMQPQHAATAARRGSWGVGLFYFRVRAISEAGFELEASFEPEAGLAAPGPAAGRIFDLYYDRAPKDADHRKGAWFLYRELA